MQPYIAIPGIFALVYRAWSHKSLTPFGIVVATATAVIHAIHPWSVWFALLTVFFLGGSRVTKVKHEIKQRLTQSAAGASGGEGPRTHIQVLANSIVASTLILLHAHQLRSKDANSRCWSGYGDLLVIGIVAQYSAVAADTYSSELGILSRSHPRLITSPTLRKVPPGTNGGVTVAGILAGLLGAFTIGLTSALLLPHCSNRQSASKGETIWQIRERLVWIALVTICGGLGSLLDSFLGGLLQASVIDIRTHKVVEGEGGHKVLVDGPGSLHYSKLAQIRSAATSEEGPSAVEQTQATSPNTIEGPETLRQRGPKIGDRPEVSSRPSRKVISGRDLLDNNGVNLLMAFSMSFASMFAASWYWDIPLQSILQ
ncbi:hypothetical protein L228DRAFT_267178 [Xylona heveae TC161]|uniref:DUF92-domain-containing protein n=1 Tax=Xylona heveae (strain CBS 132557 / TC161) TaxID=1328760 RepID=A0A165H978_XYLHT|nr:hypothetical protein L228DRAFT_267178 [Xylona heveae TC161]KZF23163.1 hypothetical protein L228DRAFT_267178 [Xylona heveae TC161]